MSVVPQLTSQNLDADLASANTIIEAEGVNIYYGDFLAFRDANLRVPEHKITSLIGPSGSGKSTLLRAFNRMNDLIPSARRTSGFPRRRSPR